MKAFTRSAGIASLVVGLALSLPVAADEYQHMQPHQGMHYGQGMMQGYGQGMMQGYGPMMGYGGMGMMHGGPMMAGPGMGYGMGMIHGGPMMGYGMGMGGMGMMPCPLMVGAQGMPGYGLQLDEAQQEKMSQIREKFWQQQQDQMQEMWEHHSEMQKLWLDGSADNDKILDAHRKMQQDQLKMLEERLNLQKEMDAVLTDEQRQQLKQMRRGMYPGS
ncbi:Spy/CpxP family protein refolding chaperone [Marinobacterium lutimaris]|uniref:Signaling pathway modulator ZraP n=1 Tax=Marinobacterium lutimaris TaxID=568106 RepID=A0A1H6C313_9GAMM|nr:Spy/CpxP family protein refolding chaperone [Marinobacterium lutimaris]SEG67273.1 LTXXQ motif family protein [Marinobacterium lutimaris]